ncbi:alpha/beta hydrolase-fold protein [uncultured Psychroserpens sp.]|uniref:alpha/beta hydrolase n=1 Tax=uncultured Psychroserpens sp. TaxID=255436 RepID=UPI00260BC55C|nr:alpha/beta hydrolase-fold protein [uncultured Psychroserpens sp.]
MKQLILVIAIVLMYSCHAQSNGIKVSKETPKVEFKLLKEAELYSGTLHRLDSFPSKYIKPRPVDVWLPKDYSTTKNYAVLYMHDGQNLFDSTTTWNKQEWKVDDWASKLMSEGKTRDFIVVGVHNIPQIRWLDLFPQKAFDYINKKTQDSLLDVAKKNNFKADFNGDNYLKFIVEELKPIIDETYATLSDKNNTFVAGSSMGGLMSMYAMSEYPDIFSAAACVSTHWVGAMPMPNNPYPEAIFQYMEANLPSADTHRIYFDYGNKTLDAFYPKFAPRVDEILKQKGYTAKNSKNVFFEGTDHSENSWNKRLDQPLTFLLGIN